MADPIHGLGLLILASVVNTGFAVSMKQIRGWRFENIWLVWAVLALILLPLVLTLATVPSIELVYGSCRSVVLTVAALGLVWGASQIFLGKAVAAVGIGVSFALILGLSALVGSLVPLAERGAHVLPTAAGLTVTAGMLVMMLGVGVCAKAGWQRDKAQCTNPTVAVRGLLYCLVAGLGSGLMNLALVFGAPMISAVHASAGPTVWSANIVWLPFLWSGAIPNVLYCLWLLRQNRSVGYYADNKDRCSWRFAISMSVCWLGSAVLYTLGASRMGTWGPVFAWPVYMSLIVVAGNVAGVLTGEWKFEYSGPLRQMTQGIGLLILAIFVLATGERPI